MQGLFKLADFPSPQYLYFFSL